MIRVFIIIFWVLVFVTQITTNDSLFFMLVDYAAILAVFIHFLEYLYFYNRIRKKAKFVSGFAMTMLFGFEYIRGLR